MKNSVRNLFSNQIALALKLLLGTAFAVAISACSMEAKLFEGASLGISSISGKLVGYSSASSFSIQSSGTDCTAPTARLYKMTVAGELAQPALETSVVDNEGTFKFSSQASGLVDYSGTTLVVEVRGCDSSIYYRPVTGGANQDVTMASSLLGFILNTNQKNALFKAMNTNPQSLAALMTVLSSATDMQKAYDILVASSDASDRFTNLFGFSAETLLNAAPVVLSSSLPTAAQEKISVNMNAQAVHWSSSYNIIYQWALDGRVIGTTSNLDYVASGDSQGHHTLTLTVGRNDGSGGVDLTRETYILTSQIEIANNVLPQPPTFMITAPSVSNGLPINTRALTVTLNTGASKANCDTFKNLLLNENPTVPTAGESFPITCTQNNSQALSYTLTSAGDGTKALYLWAQDSAGVISQMPTTLNFTLDTTAPTVSITTQPLAQSRLNSQSFAFAGDDGVGAIDHFECKMDSGAWALCSSPVAYTGLVEGNHTVYVRAVDTAGNTSVPDSKVWHIDLTAPVLLLAGPNSLTNSLSASFTLSATDSGGSGVASYQCSVDGGAYAACTAISSYVLAAGSHTFKARAYDGAGNVSAVQTFSWTIDTTPPTTTLTSKPSALTNALTATFGFVGSDTGGGNIAGFECSLDGASYGACTTGKSYSALADGVHTFQVRATDTAGNIGNAATYSWTVDSSTPMASLSLYPDSITNETSATFAFSATAPAGGSITGYQCQINGSAWTSCTSPKNYTSFVQGTQTFGVRSIDNNSNISTPTTYTWVVDTTAPTLTITDKPNALTNLSTAQFKFDGVDTGGGSIDSFYCQLDGAAFTQCSSPRDLSGLTQGTHTFNVKVTDTAGNTSAVSSYSWVVDLTAPTMTLLTTPDLLTNATTAAFTFSSVDSGGGSLAGSYCSLDGSTPDSCVSGVSYSSLAGGVHTFEVHSVDTAGNSSSTASYTWTIDVTPPVVTLTSKPLANWNSAAATFAFVGSDNGGGSVAGYQCKLDSGSYAACTSGVTFTSLSDGVHTFAVYATDTAGNQSAIVSYSWTTDTVTPVVAITSPSASGTVVPVGSLGSYVISGTCSENGSVVNIAGLSVTPASCSGGTWSATLNLTSLVDATYTLSASQTDAAGNVGSSASKTIIKDATAPTITLTTPVATRGGAALGINWVATEANVATSTSFSIELYDGSAWSSFGTAAATAGTNAAKAYSLSTVNVPSLDTASARVRVTLTDAAGNSTTVTSGTFVVDSSAPVLSTFTLNDGLASTANNNVRVGFAANDSLTNIAKICMMTSNTAPTSASSCWVTVSSYGLTASKNLSTSNIYFNVGLVSGTFPVYIWLMDAVGNISVNHAALGVDRGSVVYNSPTPPIVNAIQLTATDAPANPPSGNDLKATSGSPIYLKWNISSSAGLSASPIKVVYMTDDATEAGAVASGLTNAANGSCTVTAGFTGCAVVNAPVGTYFRLKLKVTDALGFTTSITSNPLNSGSINFLAGNTDLGLGASAKSAILQPSGTNSLAVLDDGRIFLIDSRGLAWVNP
ncbi:MAG: Ig-like domain repeat protein, partial [Bdellovibrio sp.]|nr:Ig-like domain repeat protein [Bdellovibrio sp.]